MAEQELIIIFDDCINRLAEGATIDQCLQLYPVYAAALRPLLETQAQVAALHLPAAEVSADQDLVWSRLSQSMPAPLTVRRGRGSSRWLLLLAASIVVLLAGGSWYTLSRLNEPTEVPASAATQTPSITSTGTLSLTATLTPSLTITTTVTASHTATAVPSLTPTSSPTASAVPSQTSTATLNPPLRLSPTMTFVPGCAAPLTAEQAIAAVTRVFPNAVVTTVRQITRADGRPVWEIKTTQQITVVVDVGCGTILSIDRPGSGNSNDNNSGGGNSNSGSGNSNSSGNGNGNSNSNSNDDDDDD